MTKERAPKKKSQKKPSDYPHLQIRPGPETWRRFCNLLDKRPGATQSSLGAQLLHMGIEAMEKSEVK